MSTIEIWQIKKYHINRDSCYKKYNDRNLSFEIVSKERVEEIHNNGEMCLKCYKKFHGKTRNHSKCNKCEEIIKNIIIKNQKSYNISGFNFKNIYDIKKIKKNDLMFKAFYKGKIVKVGIQIKRYNYGFVENWINPYKLLDFIKNDDDSKKEVNSLFEKIKLKIYKKHYIDYKKKNTQQVDL